MDQYIDDFPPNVQKILEHIRRAICTVAPDAQETLKCRMPTFVLHENLVHFAAFANHVGFYPTPSAISKFKDELLGYQSAKGSVQFPVLRKYSAQWRDALVNLLQMPSAA